MIEPDGRKRYLVTRTQTATVLTYGDEDDAEMVAKHIDEWETEDFQVEELASSAEP